MKNIYLTLSVVAVFSFAAQAQQSNNTAEAAPSVGQHNFNPSLAAPWQVLFSYDITAAGAGSGNAGVVQFGTEFWVSRWGSDTIWSFSLTGSLNGSFTVPGVTGVRSMTTDGTSIYAGANTAVIYAYDPTANSNAGGFWVGTWATDFTLVDMTGVPVSQVAAGLHGLTATYGLGFDNTNAGGPYLWAFHQTGTTTNNADLIQVNVATGVQTSVIHNVTADMGTAGDLAGGCHIVSTPALSLIGVLQGSPNYLFAYDIAGVTGIQDNTLPIDFLSVLPNPSSDMINVRVRRENTDAMQMQIVDVTGKVVFETNTVALNNYINVSSFAAGVYFIKVVHNGKVETLKMVRN
ncbi:MAG: T9SS type A sorting domain-containing protein [Bacteroidetes bacterium]|nr:T9SS type A sorting domain-containing protein [Bacteroidota bacterium]